MSPETEILELEAVQHYVELARKLCGGQQIIDFHVHATEVIRHKIRYAAPVDDIFSAEAEADVPYHPPKAANIRLSTEQPTGPVSSLQNRLSELAFTRAYRHTGAPVIRDQMDLASVDTAILLPVENGNMTVDEQMSVISHSCQRDQGLLAGYCVPASVADGDIYDVLSGARMNFDIRAVKIHPNLSTIDISSAGGRARVEAIIEACGLHGLPVVIHGGCSPILGDSPACRFGVLENLSKIDWSRSAAAVVIAHFGVYGCTDHQISASQELEDGFAALVRAHPNIYTDTSGVSYKIIRRMLARLDTSRVVFGSDALYVPMYRQVVYVVHAMIELGFDAADIVNVLSGNARRLLGMRVPATT